MLSTIWHEGKQNERKYNSIVNQQIDNNIIRGSTWNIFINRGTSTDSIMWNSTTNPTTSKGEKHLMDEWKEHARLLTRKRKSTVFLSG